MSRATSLQFGCDVCSSAKEENNGRWRVTIAISLMGVKGFAVYEWNDQLATMVDANHTCGDRCQHTLMERAFALQAARAKAGGAA